MCRETVKGASAGKDRFILCSKESFVGKDGGSPSKESIMRTSVVIFFFLVAMELSLRGLFIHFQDFHPLLEDETNRNILARHIGVDSLSCFIVTFLGWQCRHSMWEMVDAVNGKQGSMAKAYEQRMYTYRPEGFRISLFFIVYSFKNTIDTIIWNDGIEFIIHHSLCLFTAWGALFPGTAHFYAPFYFGVSEVSTAVLCLLANFDDAHGVKGLTEAWPVGKVVFGAAFAVLFIFFRVICWSAVSYFYCRDAWNALSGVDPRTADRKTYLRFTFVSLSLLSLLQILWLGQIFIIGKEELQKMGMI